MTSNAKKKQFIKKLLQYSFDKSMSEELEIELRSLLKQDAREFKLYKYRSFDAEGYSLSNLQTQTLRCSRRSTFNDPFDCRVGLDFDSFVAAYIDVDTERIATLFQKFLLVVANRAKYTDFSEEDQVVLKRWKHSRQLNDFCLRCNSKDMSPNQLRKLFSKKPELIYELVHGAMADGKYREAFQKKKDEFEERTSHLLSSSNVSSLSKGIYESEAKRKGITIDADQIDLVSALYQDQDPDAAQKIRETFASFDAKMADLFDNLLFVGSLCTDYRNPLMWAHYADSHKGFCVEFDCSTEIGQTPPLFPVIYSKDIVKMPWKYCLTPEGTKDPEFSARLIQAVLTKDDVWKYENEWRILLPNTYEQNYKMPRISCVYLGAFCSKENGTKILDIAKQDGFMVKRMTVDRGKFAFHTVTIYEPQV